jgi:hypothetical protein
MQTVNEALVLLKRQAVLESAMKLSGGIRITEEQELHIVRRRLAEYPEATRAVLHASHSLRRPVADLDSNDVEAWATSHE